jgi:hypothetical protein
MSKADICTTPIRSRRVVLTGMAAAAAIPIAAALPTAAPAFPALEVTTDPIFAVLDKFYRADAAFMAHDGSEEELDELGDVQSAASDLVIQTRPTTLAGLVALTTWVRERYEWLHTNGSILHEGGDYAIAAAIEAAAKAVTGRQG